MLHFLSEKDCVDNDANNSFKINIKKSVLRLICSRTLEVNVNIHLEYYIRDSKEEEHIRMLSMYL